MGTETENGTAAERDKPQAVDHAVSAKIKKYGFFAFKIRERLASIYGLCAGFVDIQTGEIQACITYGLMSYREEYRLNISDTVSLFPCTVEDRIIIAAREALLQEKKCRDGCDLN